MESLEVSKWMALDFFLVKKLYKGWKKNKDDVLLRQLCKTKYVD
jgi:hypothetical protein